MHVGARGGGFLQSHTAIERGTRDMEALHTSPRMVLVLLCQTDDCRRDLEVPASTLEAEVFWVQAVKSAALV
jgi:hypothetical protein